MLHHLAARAFLMIGEGAHPSDAIAWVIRLPQPATVLSGTVGGASAAIRDVARLLFKNPIVHVQEVQP